MATTSPDEIYSPDAGQQYALTQDLLLMADSVQDALDGRGRALSGAGAPGVGLTAPEGSTYRNTTNSDVYLRTGGAWVPMLAVGNWTPYTPTLTGSSGTPTVGNSVLTGGFIQMGSTIHFRQSILIGTTANFAGAGVLRMSLPKTSSSGWVRSPVVAHLENSGIGFYPGAGFIDPSSTYVSYVAFGAGGIVWSDGSGIAVGSRISIAGTYGV